MTFIMVLKYLDVKILLTPYTKKSTQSQPLESTLF